MNLWHFWKNKGWPRYGQKKKSIVRKEIWNCENCAKNVSNKGGDGRVVIKVLMVVLGFMVLVVVLAATTHHTNLPHYENHNNHHYPSHPHHLLHLLHHSWSGIDHFIPVEMIWPFCFNFICSLCHQISCFAVLCFLWGFWTVFFNKLKLSLSLGWLR